jgi:cytochrome c peroxidase
MHDGRIKKLKEVIQHYSNIPLSKPLVSKELKLMKNPFTEEEQKDLLAFLKTLSDISFLYNKEFMFPKNDH